jgi:hypothetical protein
MQQYTRTNYCHCYVHELYHYQLYPLPPSTSVVQAVVSEYLLLQRFAAAN